MFTKVFAQGISPINNPAIPKFLNKDPMVLFGTFVAGIVGVLLLIASIYAFFQLIIGGFNWISSSGDKGKLEDAQNRIRDAIIGLFIVFAAWSIFLFLLKFLGVMPNLPGGAIRFNLPTLFGP